MNLLTNFTGLRLFLLLSFTSVFASPHLSNGNKEKIDNHEKITIAMIRLVEDAYNDSISKLLFEYEVKRMQAEFNTSIPERKNRIEKFLELSKKEKLSDEDVKYVATELGFDNTEEYVKYLDLGLKLIEKYEIMKLDKESQLVFCDLFFHKLIEEMKGKGSIVFIKFNKNMSSINPNFPPECHKCVWDYHACMIGTATSLNSMITNQMGKTTGQIIASGGNLLTTATATNQGIFIYTSWDTTTCVGNYRSCISQCKN